MTEKHLSHENQAGNGKGKVSFYEICRTLVAIINQSVAAPPQFPRFPYKWVTVDLSPGVKQIYEKTSRGLKAVSEDYCKQELSKYLSHESFILKPDFHLLPAKLQVAIEHWLHQTASVKPKLFTFANKEELAYVTLPWPEELYEKMPTPNFDELFSRMTNAEAFQEWIGSLFFEETDRQQYVWVYGKGGDGKGALLRCLHVFMGNLFGVKQARKEGDNHWAENIVGKRLIAFPDTNSSMFPLSGYFKMLTGDDPIEVNQKFKTPYTTRIFAKFLFLSNTTPDITAQRSDKRRLIYVTVKPLEVEPTPEEMAVYEDKLLVEAPFFFKRCMDLFLSKRDHLKIPINCDFSEYDSLAEENDEENEYLASFFEFRSYFYFTPCHLQDFLREKGIRDGFRVKRFKDYLKRKHSIEKKMVKLSQYGARQWAYVGLRRLQPHDVEIENPDANCLPNFAHS
jgi:hypothetical protein